jgi:hypothetical protein
VAPGAVIPVETDQPRTRIDVEFLRYPRATPESTPSIRKINQPSFAYADIDRDEVAYMLVNVLLHGIAPIDAGTDLAEHLAPRASNLRVQVAAQRREVLVEFTIAVARSHAESHRPVKIVA